MTRRLCLGLVLLALGLLTNCGWERKLIFQAPSHDASIELYQPFPLNASGLRIVLNHQGTTTVLFDKRVDAYIQFADVVWPTNDTVAVFIWIGGSPIEVAYDLLNKKFVPYGTFRPTVAKHIRETYSLRNVSTDIATLAWACNEGREPFLKRNPDAAPR
jgi:hypothetical protein